MKKFRRIWLLLLGFCGLSVAVMVLSLRYTASLPELVSRELTAGEMAQVIARNSPLTQYVRLSPNASFPRQGRVEKITIHHMADNLSLEVLGEAFSNRDRQASSNYAIDSSGRVALYVEEVNEPWTSSNRDNDSKAVTIEVANDQLGGEWHVSDAAFDALVELCADICLRNGIDALVFTGTASGNLTLHNMFADTECPGPYLERRIPDLVQAVNLRLDGA